jgi:6-pyruvoyltetrahydropterin/6-carboxytetrahydropterin synthase
MYQITKRFEFSASHQLKELAPNHPCARLHGHNYIIEVVLQAETLNPVGFVVDYGDLVTLKHYIDSQLDHRHLNDVILGQPSAENIAKHLFDWCKSRWPQIVAVRVSETPKTWAEYRD